MCITWCSFSLVFPLWETSLCPSEKSLAPSSLCPDVRYSQRAMGSPWNLLSLREGKAGSLNPSSYVPHASSWQPWHWPYLKARNHTKVRVMCCLCLNPLHLQLPTVTFRRLKSQLCNFDCCSFVWFWQQRTVLRMSLKALPKVTYFYLF